MGVSVHMAIVGSQQKAGGVSSRPCNLFPNRSLMSPMSLLAKNLTKNFAKMLTSIFAVFCIFACTVFYSKPLVAKGFKKCDNCMQISAPYKTTFLLKPFINAHLAVSQLGMRQVKVVSHFVSFLGSSIMGIWASAHSHSGKTRQVKGVSHFVSFFAQRDLTTLKKLSNLCTVDCGPLNMHYPPPPF